MLSAEQERQLEDLPEKLVNRAFELQKKGHELAAQELIKVSEELLAILGYI